MAIWAVVGVYRCILASDVNGGSYEEVGKLDIIYKIVLAVMEACM